MTDITDTRFDYGQLSGDDSQYSRDAAGEIHRLGKQTVESIVEIGGYLVEVKRRLPHGQWLPWLEAEFPWSDGTARRYMDSHKLVKSSKFEDLPKLLELPPAAVADLAASSTPEAARKEVLAKVKQGEPVRHSDVRQIIRQHKLPSQPTTPTVTLYPEPTDKPAEFVQLSSVATASVTLGLQQMLRRLEDARDIMERDDSVPPAIQKQLRTLLQAVKDQLWHRETSHSPRHE